MSVSWLDIFFLHLWNTRGTAHTQSRPFTVNLSPQPSSFRDKFEIRKTKLKCNVSYIFNIQESNYFCTLFSIFHNNKMFITFITVPSKLVLLGGFSRFKVQFSCFGLGLAHFSPMKISILAREILTIMILTHSGMVLSQFLGLLQFWVWIRLGTGYFVHLDTNRVTCNNKKF